MKLLCTVEEGELRGQRNADIQGTPFLSFLGVPYAKAPIGKLRFKAPQPPNKWEGTRDATKQGEPCYSVQINLTEEGLKFEMEGSEDCLFLNIFTRKVLDGQTGLKPVMVFFHGGAFVTGSSDIEVLGPEYLMTQDVVLVTVQYRLGALGFLTVDDPALGVTGNAGLKDQVQALKWLQKNIKQFCGDPNNVTIFGHSAGGASVHFLVLSPMAKGLFHKAILHSGTSLCPWARGVNSATNLAKILGCTETQNDKILQFLQEISVEKLLEAQELFGSHGLNPSTKRHFGPTVEPKVEGAFLSAEPLDVIKSGFYNHVPMMFGYTSHEGMIEAHAQETGLGGDFQHFVPYYFDYEKNSKEFVEVNKTVARFYFGAEEPEKDTEETFYDVLTDTIFLYAIYLAVKTHAKTCQKPVYFYRMSLDTDMNLFKKMTRTENKGACHGDDMGYLFKTFCVLEPGTIEETSVFRFVKMWANFARSGNPIPVQDPDLNCEWKPVAEDELNFLDIGTELVPGTDPDIERMKFWDEVGKEIKYRY